MMKMKLCLGLVWYNTSGVQQAGLKCLSYTVQRLVGLKINLGIHYEPVKMGWIQDGSKIQNIYVKVLMNLNHMILLL